jgi:hypothetical protein
MSETDALTGATAAVQTWMDDPGAVVLSAEGVARLALTGAGWLPDGAQPTPAQTDRPDGVHDRAAHWMLHAPGYRFHRDPKRDEISPVVEGLMARKAFGLRKYGTTLNPDSRRDPIGDMLDEVLDAIAYAQVAFEEALEADDESRRSFAWLRRSRLTDEAIELYREQARLADTAARAWPERVDIGTGRNEGDEAALAVRADRSEA